MLNWNSYLPDELRFFPGIDLEYRFMKHLALTASYNYSLGLPTFTDLSYQDASNQGNNQLKPYSQHSYEAGLKTTLSRLQARAVVFYTKGKNNIEWVMNDTLYRFSPINISTSENTGIEISIRYNPVNADQLLIPNSIYLGYTAINTYRDVPDAISKYNSLRNKFVLSVQHTLIKNLTLSWNLMIKNRQGNFVTYDFENALYVANEYPRALLLDARLSYSYKWVSVYTEGTNLLDKIYYESGSIPQPGRWIIGGVNIRLSY
jgi:iron complex outermembrane receptor protein